MAGASGVKVGSKVLCDVGKGTRIGFVLEPEHDVGGELKAAVQVGSSVYVVGYREPGDRDEGGAGLTFWLEGLG